MKNDYKVLEQQLKHTQQYNEELHEKYIKVEKEKTILMNTINKIPLMVLEQYV